jgi:hypothetical protein
MLQICVEVSYHFTNNKILHSMQGKKRQCQVFENQFERLLSVSAALLLWQGSSSSWTKAIVRLEKKTKASHIITVSLCAMWQYLCAEKYAELCHHKKWRDSLSLPRYQPMSVQQTVRPPRPLSNNTKRTAKNCSQFIVKYRVTRAGKAQSV